MMRKSGGIAAAVLLLAVAGCKSSSSPFSVNLTIVADSSLSDAVVQRIGDLSVDVSGAETSHRDMLVSLPFATSRQERVTYRSGATTGQLLFDITARANDGTAVGFGEAVANISGSSTNVTLTLTDQIPAGMGDMAGGGDMGPPPPTLTSTLVKAGAYDLFGNHTSPDGSMIGIVTRDSKATPTILDYMGKVQVTLDDGAQPAPNDSSSHKPGFFPGNSVIYTLAANSNGAAPLKIWYPGAASIITLSMISYPIVGVQTNDDGSYVAFEDNPMNNGAKTDLKYGPRSGPLETVVSQNSYWYMLFRFAPKTGIFYSPVDSVPAGKVDILRIAAGASATTAVRICLSCGRSYVISADGTQLTGLSGVTTFPDGSGKLSTIATSNNTADAMTTAASANTINPWMQLVPGTSLMEAVGPPTTPDPTGQNGNIIEINLSTSAVKIRQQDAIQPYIIAASAQWVMFSQLMAAMAYGTQYTALQPIASTTSTTVAKGVVQIDATDASGAFTVVQNVPEGNTYLPVINVVSAAGVSVGQTAPGSFHSTFVDSTHILYMQGDELRAMDLGTGNPTILDYGVGDYAYHAGTKRLFYVKRGNKAAPSDGLYLATY
jgi:hypothetical protein